MAASSSLGDRISMTVGSETTTYTLDLATPLVQVIVANGDGAQTAYLYGVTRIGEEDGTWHYYLVDHLGSVRSLVDAEGSVAATRAYQPYGASLESAGVAESVYGFTGEQTDPTGLVYLRARYLLAEDEHFISEDPWPGAASEPQSLNGYSWVEGNPVNATDPLGLLSNASIARSFGVDQFDDVIVRFQDYEHWGFLAALQDAKMGDRITLGADGMGASMARFRIRCKDGLVVLDPWESGLWSPFRGLPMTLDEFEKVVLQEKATVNVWATSRGTPPWRLPDGWNWTFVNEAGGKTGKGYPDSSRTQLPDFKSAVNPLVWPLELDLKIIVGGGIQSLIDRYGNQYLSISIAVGVGSSTLTYVEGYVRGKDLSKRLIADEQALKNDMLGWDLEFSGGLIQGTGFFASGWGQGGVVYSVGPQAEVSGGVSGTILLGKDHSQAWDWIDRVPFYKAADIRTSSAPELEMCDDCANYPFP
jgi:RHS repeat-associated protein